MAQDVVLTEERKGQIALIILKQKIAQDSHIPLNKKDFNRSLGQAVEQLRGKGILKEELFVFQKELIEDAIKNLFDSFSEESNQG